MGCWNGTCGFTNQSIGAGEDVIAFIILFQPDVANGCYGNNVAEPISFPIHGKYDDYGCVEDVVDTFGARLAVASFNKWLREGKLTATGRDSLPSEYKNVEQIFNEIQEGLSLTIDHPYASLPKYEGQKQTRQLGFQLNLKSAMLSAWETVNGVKTYELEGKNWETFGADAQLVIDKAIAVGNRTLDQIEADMKALRPVIDDDKQAMERYMELYDEQFKKEHEHKSFSKGWGDGIKGSTDQWNYASSILTPTESTNNNLWKELFFITRDELFTPDQNDDLKNAINQFCMTHWTNLTFRKSWGPQGHFSQMDNLDETIEFMERQLKRLKAQQNKRAEEWYDDDEEYKISVTDHKELDYSVT